MTSRAAGICLCTRMQRVLRVDGHGAVKVGTGGSPGRAGAMEGRSLRKALSTALIFAPYSFKPTMYSTSVE